MATSSKPVRITKEFVALLENLEAVTAFVESCADSFGMNPHDTYNLLLALEESYVNICRYAYGSGTGDATITCYETDTSWEMEISDHGVAFDVLARPEPDTTLSVKDRPIGGLGIFLIKKLSDHVKYQRIDDRNVLTIGFDKVKKEKPKA